MPFHVGDSTLHFACSDALVRQVRAPIVWWHATDHPTIILGVGQREDDLDWEACERAKVRVVRRQSGGAAVYASSDVLGLDIALPAGHALASSDILEAYRWFGQVWLEAVRALDVDATLVSIEDARALTGKQKALADPVLQACFGSLSPYEVVVGRRKLVGLSQVRRRSGVLLQAGIHLHLDAQALAELLPAKNHEELADALKLVATGLDEVGGKEWNAGDVMDAFMAALVRRTGAALYADSWTEQELQHVTMSGTPSPQPKPATEGPA